MTSGGSRKSLTRTALEKRDRRALGGRLALQGFGAFAGGQMLGHARSRPAARHRRGEAEQGNALAGPHQHLGDGKRQHQRTVALGDGGEVAAEGHGGRNVGPEPEGVRGLPFALADVERVGAGRTPPVDDGGRIAALELAELPERLARSGATPAVDAMHHRVGNAQRLEQQIRQTIGERLRFAFELEDARATFAVSVADPRAATRATPALLLID